MNSSIFATPRTASFIILTPGASGSRPFNVRPDAPATLAMTDFRSAPLITTTFDASIYDSLNQMKLSGARFAFVLGPDRQLVGSITSYDILGEKPVRYMVSVGCSETTGAWRDVQVENIMEPVSEWPVLDYSQVAKMDIARVAAIIAESGRRHIVVVEAAADSNARQLRGLFSETRLQMLLGGGHSAAVATTPIARRDMALNCR
jgi:CBS-domain-containing membrane protein